MKFSLKKFTSLSLGFSFLVMTYTGVMLYFVPRGKVAYWSNWHLLGLSKSQYGDIHTTSMIVFLFFGFLHIYYNWKPLLSYVKNAKREISFLKSEFLAAFFLNLFFVVGTIYMVQPFKAYLNFEESIKAYWARAYGEPPYGHAEETTLKVFCKKTGINYNDSIKLLQQKGFVVTADETLKDIAKKNGISPQDIYKVILKQQKRGFSGRSNMQGMPSMLGRRTLRELSDDGYIDLQKAVDVLHKKGLKSVELDVRIKNIADELDMMPFELYQLIKK